MIGRTLGPYEVVAKLGEGGMGEVYRARDTALNREVAIKVMPEALAGDPDRLARFQREAESLAALNHPNIAQVYGLERNGEVPAIVMELVEGEDLSTSIARGPFAIDDALAIARQLIDALEAAHERGIIHRDLKPANIKVREDGTVKVLDFGLARTLDPGPGTQDTYNSPTLTARATQMGMIIGTASYMSPEQARGRPVDKRTDVWAFGCVLFEMLTGRKTFDGEDATEIISAVVKSEPDWAVLPATVPSHVRTVIERCLLKDRKTRIPDLSVVRYMLDETIVPAAATGATPAAWWQRPMPLVVGALVLVAATAAATWSARSVEEPPARILSLDEPGATNVKISPDGTSVLFIRDGSLWVRRLDAPAGRMLVERSTAGSGIQGAAWSPGSDVIAYDAENNIMRVPVATGNPARIAASNSNVVYGMQWSAGGRLLVSKGEQFGLGAFDVNSGELAVVLALGDGDTRFVTPWELPNGQVMFSQRDKGVIEVFDGEVRHVVLDVPGAVVRSASYSPTGHVLYSQQGPRPGVWVAPYDLETWTLGEPIALTAVAGDASLSRTGLLAVAPSVEDSHAMVLVNRDGHVVKTFSETKSQTVLSPVLSPDGTRLAVAKFSRAAGNTRVFVHDLARNTSIELGSGAPGGNHRPEFWIDDTRLAYTADDNDRRVIMVEAVGSGRPPVRLPVDNLNGPVAFSKPYATYGGVDGDIWYVDVEGGAPKRFAETAAHESKPSLSPDGKYVAYIQSFANSDQTGVFVERFPEGGGRQALRTDFGNVRLEMNAGVPVWSAQDNEVFFATGAGISVVGFDSERGIATSGPRTLFEFSLPGLSAFRGSTGFTVTGDGQFIMTGSDPDAQPVEARALPVIIENWTKLINR